MKTNLGPGPLVEGADKLDKLYDKLLYWLYERQQPRRARAYAHQLQGILARCETDVGRIFASELWSLVYEGLGNIPEAIKQRRREIHLIRRLHRIAKNRPYERLVHGQYNDTDLRDRLIILAMLHYDGGDVDQAIKALEEARAFCRERGIRFGAMQLLRDYEKDKQTI
jgi:tetratricopeptide (TPR) repeat protein